MTFTDFLSILKIRNLSFLLKILILKKKNILSSLISTTDSLSGATNASMTSPKLLKELKLIPIHRLPISRKVLILIDFRNMLLSKKSLQIKKNFLLIINLQMDMNKSKANSKKIKLSSLQKLLKMTLRNCFKIPKIKILLSSINLRLQIQVPKAIEKITRKKTMWTIRRKGQMKFCRIRNQI